MKWYLFLGSMAIMMGMGSAGCSTNDEYRCESNDQCSSTSEWQYYSCSNDTGHCEKVDPLAIDPPILPDATIGQSDYKVELIASGGISPYTWFLARGDEDKLKWLTITPEGNDKAVLHNAIDATNGLLYPIEINSGILLAITLKDSSKHGTAEREDNQGKAFQMTIKINDCAHKCKRISDTEDNPTANENETECTNDMLYTCKSYFGTCVKWDGTSCPSNCKNDNISCCSGNLCGGAGDSKCELSLYQLGKAQVYDCKRDSYNCLVWDSSGINPCPKNLCDGKMCGDCTAICTPNSKDCADTKNKKLCGPDQNGCPTWISIPCDGNRTCQGGECKYAVGSTGPGGGIVFYDNPNYATDGWQYLEAAATDQSTSAPWGCYGTAIPGSNSKGIGAGKSNTKAIVDGCSDTGIAARLCYSHDLGNGYADWFPPSCDELSQLYQMKSTIVGFSDNLYWSSSNYNDYFAWIASFYSGGFGYDPKSSSRYVRCIRRGL